MNISWPSFNLNVTGESASVGGTVFVGELLGHLKMACGLRACINDVEDGAEGRVACGVAVTTLIQGGFENTGVPGSDKVTVVTVAWEKGDVSKRVRGVYKLRV